MVCPILSDRCLSVTLVYCSQTVRCIKIKLGMEVGLGADHIVLDGDPTPQQQKQAQQPRVRWGPSPLSKGAQPPFSARVCCGQTAGSINMPLGRETDIGPGNSVLDGDPAPPPSKVHSPLIFGPCLLCQTAARIKIPLGMVVGLGPGHIVRWGPDRGTTAPALFGRVYCSETVAHIRYCRPLVVTTDWRWVFLWLCLCVQGASIDVECPTFHMKCLPYQTAAERRERALRTKKQNWSHFLTLLRELKVYHSRLRCATPETCCYAILWNVCSFLLFHVTAANGAWF